MSRIPFEKSEEVRRGRALASNIYTILLVLVGIWLLAIVGGYVVSFPEGEVGLILILVSGLIALRLLHKRIHPKEEPPRDLNEPI